MLKNVWWVEAVFRVFCLEIVILLELGSRVNKIQKFESS